jgi:hypothetical protein
VGMGGGDNLGGSGKRHGPATFLHSAYLAWLWMAMT